MKTTAWRRADNVLAHDVDGQIVLIVLGSNACTYLNATGSALWTRIDGRQTAGDLAEALADACGLERTVAEADVEAFLDQLRQMQILAGTDGAPSEESAAPQQRLAFPEAYEAPAVAPLETLVAMGGCLRSDVFICGVGGIRSA